MSAVAPFADDSLTYYPPFVPNRSALLPIFARRADPGQDLVRLASLAQQYI